ncbi:MAG: hypothetical protein ACRDPD_27370 [Streptosporangiaceae bacterium]
MSAQSQAPVAEATESACWCCGHVTAEDALVRLGNHPEVGICLNCVHYLGRRARDYRATAMRQRLRATAESVRAKVTARGWHRHPVFGPALRQINRHLPW